MIYNDFKQWKEGVIHRLKMVFFGSLGFIYFGLIIGMVSLFVYCIRQINAFYRRETIAAGIVTVLLVLMSVGWVVSFVKERHLRVRAQHRADSLAYDLGKFTQMYDSTSIIVIDGDTLNCCK